TPTGNRAVASCWCVTSANVHFMVGYATGPEACCQVAAIDRPALSLRTAIEWLAASMRSKNQSGRGERRGGERVPPGNELAGRGDGARGLRRHLRRRATRRVVAGGVPALRPHRARAAGWGWENATCRHEGLVALHHRLAPAGH